MNEWPCIVTNSLWIKPTDAMNSNFIGITIIHVLGSLSARHQEFSTIYRLWYILRSCDEQFATRSRMELQFHPTPGSKRPQLRKMYQSRCMAKNSWWWAERLPEICRVVIPLKLEFSASVGFSHKEDPSFLSAFAQFEKVLLASSYVCLSVRPSAHCTDFHAICYLNIFENLSRKVNFH